VAQTSYAYKVRDAGGKVIEGTIEADNPALVAKRLRLMGYTPVNIEPKSAGGMNRELHIPGLGGHVGLKDIAIFSRQFATLISSGLTLVRSLSILADQTESEALLKIVSDVRSKVESGISLSEALSRHARVFSRLYIAMVRAGEVSGGLDQALVTLADMLEKQAALRGKVKSAMAYPVAVLSLVLLIVSAIILFIVPIFKKIFASLNGTLPLPTRVLIDVSDVAVKLAVPLLALGILVVVLVRRWKRTPQGRAMWDITMLKVPVFGQLVRKMAVSRFCSTLSSLLRAGVPVLESLEITKETVNNVVVARAIEGMSDGVRRGEPMAGGLGSAPVFPPMVAQMMAVGEETGALDSMLGRASAFLEEEVERMVGSLTSLLEPMMIVVLGGTVGTMVICLYLPMFKVDTLVNPNN